MSAASFGSLLSSTSYKTPTETEVRFWRRTYKVSDPRARVGRRWGNGSPPRADRGRYDHRSGDQLVQAVQ
jgi:hypothetical protein